MFKNIEPDELKTAIRALARGEASLTPTIPRQVLDRLVDRPAAPDLPALTISEATVRSHAKSILAKLNQPNRAQAVLTALRAGLVDLPEESA